MTVQKYNYKELKLRIDKIIKEKDRILTFNELSLLKGFPKNYKNLNLYYKNNYNMGYFNYYRNLGFGSNNDYYYKGKYISNRNITYEILIDMIKDFCNEKDRFPLCYEFSKDNNLITYNAANSILKSNNTNFDKIANQLGYNRITRNEGYEYWLTKLKEVCATYGNISGRKYSKYGLPEMYWYVENCTNKEVHNYEDFLKLELGVRFSKNLTKEDYIPIILKEQSKLNRPLMYDDFRGVNHGITIGTIIKLWGTFNNMKKELGLEIIQEDMTHKHKSKEEMLIDLNRLKEELGRVPLSREIDGCSYCLGSGTYNREFGGINNAIKKLGYKPNKTFFSKDKTNEEIVEIYKNFMKDNNIESLSDECARKYDNLPNPTTVQRRFNCTWNEFIEMIGFNPNYKIGGVYYSDDDIKCLSEGEVIIHNYLLKLPIDNITKETYYKDILEDRKLKQLAGRKRLDWTFIYNNKTYYVELFGMIGVKKYRNVVREKFQLMEQDNKLDYFIPIYPRDLAKLNKIFSFIK